MPDVREKLVELLNGKYDHYCDQCGVNKDSHYTENLADYLIANGVTIQRWIPVAERLPELIPSNAGKAYSEAVNVCTNGRKVMVAVWDGIDWLCDMDYWEAWGETITHWTPVILPLPQPSLPEPPKGE